MKITSFCEERFPLGIAFGTSGGPERRTDIVRLSNGFENRNQRTRHSLRRYDAGSGVKSLRDLMLVLEFFEARRGRLVGFRFRDPFDARSARWGEAVTPLDQRIGTGDGQTATFELTKRYGTGADSYSRPIRKPLASSVTVAVDGKVVPALVDETTGFVTLSQPASAGAIVTAGFEFDVPVRFDMDHLAINVAAFEAGEIPTIPLVEVRT